MAVSPPRRRFAALVALALPALSFAQATHVGLAGLRAVSIEVQAVDAESKACGLSDGALDAAVRLPLSSSKLAVSASAPAYVYVRVTAAKLEGTTACVATYTMFMMRDVWLTARGGQVATASVWSGTQMLWGPSATTGNRVADSLERSTKLLIAAWLRANE